MRGRRLAYGGSGATLPSFTPFPRRETFVSSGRNFCFPSRKLLFHFEETFVSSKGNSKKLLYDKSKIVVVRINKN